MRSYSVTEFVGFLNSALSEAVFPDGVVIEGEVAEYRVSQGKWIWFLLKDEESVLSCFSMTWKLRQPIEDGLQVRVFGQAKVHSRSGKFSVVVDRLEPVGEGALRRAYELLRRTLESEGLFEPVRKRPLPRFPRRIGLLASHESAAYTDFLRILRNRWSDVEILSHHVQVQGREAVESILDGFRYFNELSEPVDVLVLTRGGGSLEDLQAFNSEAVVRAVFSSVAPIVVGVGHERDETLADFAADQRASTPSNAAELVVPDRTELQSAVQSLERRLVDAMTAEVNRWSSSLERCVGVMERGVVNILTSFRQRQAELERIFASFSERVDRQSMELDRSREELETIFGRQLDRIGERLSASRRLLESYDPRAVLRRGYAIVREPSGRIVQSPVGVVVGTRLGVELHRGSLDVEVLSGSTDSKKKNP